MLTDASLIGLALSAFTSATILPGASEAVLAAMHAAEVRPAGMLLAIASIGNITGSCVNWILGRYLSRFSDRRWFPVSPAQLERASGWPSLLLSWLPVIGDPLTVVAGLLRTPFPVFLLVVAIAKTARYAAVLWLIDQI
ncbi:YqaA family protein [Aminobacter sp. J44]|uniref:YqaA family protein n=1 Tax=Aminobacter sp. J44 TaxID=935262 RepID=UPI00119A3593|nr:YqaA family protein [Aminobacter sp. J44]TWG61743.1 membrane protein YqaA with SNARE-associated domain [Aminobacter sp. J44]